MTKSRASCTSNSLFLRSRFWIVGRVPERPRGHVYERNLPPCSDLTRGGTVPLGILGTVGQSTIHADLVQDAMLIVTHLDDEVAKGAGVELTIPVRGGRVVVEHATGSTTDILVVDEHHQAFRHRKKSPPVRATWTRTAGKFETQDTSKRDGRQLAGRGWQGIQRVQRARPGCRAVVGGKRYQSGALTCAYVTRACTHDRAGAQRTASVRCRGRLEVE